MPRALSLAVLVAALAAPARADAAPAAASTAAATTKLAVYEFEVSGLEPRVGRVVTDAVLVELRKLEGISALGMDELKAMLDLESQKQLAGCADESCLADIADALGVDGLVLGNIAVVEQQTVFGMKRIDQRGAATVGSVVKRLESKGGEEVLAAVGAVVAELFPEFPLRPGQTRGVDPALALALNPPPLPAWVFYSTASAAGASALVGVSALLGFAALQLDYQAFAARGTRQAPTSAEELQAKGDLVVFTYAGAVAFGSVALLVGAVAGVAALFTDWAGHGDGSAE